MEAWIVGLIMGAIELVITTVLGLLIKSWWNKRQKEKEELEQLREEKRVASEQQRCELVKTAVHEEVIQLEKDLTAKSIARHDELKGAVGEIKSDLGLVKKGLQNNLYIDLVYIHDDYIKRGYATRDNKRDYDNLYWSYHNLGKNGIADGMHAEVMALPESPKGE